MSAAHYKVGIVGGTGYTGAELLRMLCHHPAVQVKAITSRKEAGIPVEQIFPHLQGHYSQLHFTTAEDGHLDECDIVFFATPHGVAMEQAPALMAKGVKVIDLGADFRLQNTETFAHWYKMPHTQPEVLTQAVYGLPEIHREALKNAQLVANPGCYPTTVLLGLLPLIEHGTRYMQVDPIIADCKSGVSGAGKKAEMGLLYAELSENFKAYGVAGHRHQPEISEQLVGLAKHPVELIFTPHLVPMIRGMFSTIYVRLTEEGRSLDLQQHYQARYAQEPFVEVLPANQLPETRFARGSNRLQISVRTTGKDSAIILVAQDNLVKGASGQAIQCMNVLLGLPETTGLTQIALLP